MEEEPEECLKRLVDIFVKKLSNSSFTLLIFITFSNTDSNDPRQFCRARAVFKHYAQNEMIGTSRDFTQNFEQAVNSRKAKLLSDEVTKHGH